MAAEDVNEEPPRGADLAGRFDTGFLLNPVKQRFDGLADPRHGCREQPVGGIEVRLSWGFSDRREDRKWKRGLAREIGIGLIGKEIPIGERRRDLCEDWTVIQTGWGHPEIPGQRQGSGPFIADRMNFHPVVVEFFGRTVPAVCHFVGDLGGEPSALLGQHHGEGIGDSGGGGRCTGRTELVQECRKHIRQSIQVLHVSPIAGQMGKPLAPIAVSMIIEHLDLVLFIEDAEQIERDDFFVREAEIGIGRKALYVDPKLLAIELAHGQIERDQLGLPVHGRLSAECCGILLKRHRWAGSFSLN